MALASRALNVGAGLEDKLAGDDDHQAIEAPLCISTTESQT